MCSKQEIKIRKTRQERYELQDEARIALWAAGKKKGLEYPQNYHRTAKCTHVRHSDTVDIQKSKAFNKAFYSGLAICSNVWACAVCAAKIQERRRVEIAQAFDWAYNSEAKEFSNNKKKKVIMMTFTIPHNKTQSLDFLLKAHQEALTKMRGGKQWVAIKKNIGFEGLIRSLELTYGDNGWHVHTHEAWIVDHDCDVKALTSVVLERWFKFCDKLNLIKNKQKNIEDFYRYAIDAKDNCSNSEYLAKQDDSKHWGVDRELAKGVSKVKNTNTGLHPFGFLKIISEINQIPKDDLTSDDRRDKKKYQSLFINYVDSMRHKKQIYWTQGLKKRVGLDDKTDKEIGEEQDDQADLVISLDRFEWHTVVKNKLKWKFLNLAETADKEAIEEVLKNHEEDDIEMDEMGETSPQVRDSSTMALITERQKEKLKEKPK